MDSKDDADEKVRHRVVVTSLAEAKRRIDEATEPMVLVFPPLTLGAEHRVELAAVAEYGATKGVTFQVDEADLLQTTEQRRRSTTAVFLHGRKHN